jgi:hypothetical protein
MTTPIFKPTGGLGNTLIQLTSIPDACRLLHDSVYDYELSNCVIIKGFTRVSEDGEQPDAQIYINPFTIKHVHPKIRDIIEPSDFMKGLIEENRHILKDVSCGMAIRRGSYCEDSRQYKDERGDKPHFYHCSETGLDRFKNVVRNVPGKVFLTSDSQSTLKALIDEFGEKIVTIDTIFTVGAEHDRDGEKKHTDYHNIYLLFFLLSECPHLFITGGNKDMVGFSTYAYMAAIYGNKPFDIIFNN